jgi:hypothetical protein
VAVKRCTLTKLTNICLGVLWWKRWAQYRPRYQNYAMPWKVMEHIHLQYNKYFQNIVRRWFQSHGLLFVRTGAIVLALLQLGYCVLCIISDCLLNSPTNLARLPLVLTCFRTPDFSLVCVPASRLMLPRTLSSFPPSFRSSS